jgi:hypothetical protein
MGNKVNEEAYGACNAIMRHKVTRAIKMSDSTPRSPMYAMHRSEHSGRTQRQHFMTFKESPMA